MRDRDGPSDLLLNDAPLKVEARSRVGEAGPLAATITISLHHSEVVLDWSYQQRRGRKHGRPTGRCLCRHHSRSI